MDSERMEIEKEVLARVFQLSNKLQVLLDHQLKSDNLTAKQLFLMIVLGSFEKDPGFSEISERFGTSRQNVKQLALKLEKNGYVEIYTDEMDARFKRLRFTPKAIDYWKQRDETDVFMLNKMFLDVPIEQMQGMQNTMEQMDANIRLFDDNEEVKSENEY
jgi:DNA-binding MarR family transcriptional regulator